MTRQLPRLGIVGCGRLAEAGYLPALAISRRFALAALADPDDRRTFRVAAESVRLGLTDRPPPRFADAAELAAGTGVDAVVIASPVAHHVRDAAAIVSTSTPVLVEKPPAVDAAEAAELAALAGPVWIGFNRRFAPGVAALRRAGDDEPTSFEAAISYRRAGWSAVSVRDDAIIDLGPHLVDLARWLTRDHVVSVTTARLSPERAHVELALSRGCATFTARTDHTHGERIDLRDGRGAVVGSYRLGGLANNVVDQLRRRLRPGGDPGALVASLAAQLDAFADAVRDGDHPLLGSVADGTAVMHTIDAIRAADQTRPDDRQE